MISKLFSRARAAALSRNLFRRRAKSASPVDLILADIRRLLMDPSADAQTIITAVNALPAAIANEVASEVATAEAAKNAQHTADLAAISAAVTAVASGIAPPATPPAAPAAV